MPRRLRLTQAATPGEGAPPFFRMNLPVQLLSTDFDGTLFAEFENPPVPVALQEQIAWLQARGARWVINTGRDLSSLMESIARARLTVRPDYVVVVEREIYRHHEHRYESVAAWNERCTRDHALLFEEVDAALKEVATWVDENCDADVYTDAYSPFCMIARSNAEADTVQEHFAKFCRRFPQVAFVRNDVYARLSHIDYNKGTALAEIARQLGITADHILAAGDHLNDLPMLSRQFARWLVAPANAVPQVKAQVVAQEGYVSHQPFGHGVARGIELVLRGVR
jgi:HAD superfamily hydrolase (TIGR01484 family)